MDSDRFDAITQRLARNTSRRGAFRTLVAGAAAVIGSRIGIEAEAAKNKMNEKGKKDKDKDKDRCIDFGGKCGGKPKKGKKPAKCCGDGVCRDERCACRNGKQECNGKCISENAPCVLKVTAGNSGDWVVFDNTTLGKTNGAVDFVEGPGEAPRGKGSAEFRTVAGTDKATLSNPSFEGVALADIAEFGYSTYAQTGSGLVVPAVKLEIAYDDNGTTETAHLIFEPVYYASAPNPVVEGQWQNWDLIGSDARWWAFSSTRATTTEYLPWSEMLNRHPGAVITGDFEGKFLHVETGSGTPNKAGNVDSLVINGTVFDFEPSGR